LFFYRNNHLLSKETLVMKKPFCQKQATNIGVPIFGFSARKTFYEETVSAGKARRVGAELRAQVITTDCPLQPVVIKLRKEEQS
jgi:hypothetical protein